MIDSTIKPVIESPGFANLPSLANRKKFPCPISQSNRVGSRFHQPYLSHGPCNDQHQLVGNFVNLLVSIYSSTAERLPA